MKSGAVIEGLDVIEDGGAGLGAGGEAMMVNSVRARLPWLHCVHSYATTPTPPVYIDRCISPCCEPASITVSSCGLPFGF